MNSKEHLLVCLMEEAAEVQKAASKLLRFGPCEYSPVDPEMIPNREALARELHDLRVLWKMLIEQGIVGEYHNDSEVWEAAHRASYNQHLGISKKIGRVKD